MDILEQLGVGGVIAILLLREVFSFLKKKRNGGSEPAGEKSLDFWEARCQKMQADIRHDTRDKMVAVQLEMHGWWTEVRVRLDEMDKHLAVILAAPQKLDDLRSRMESMEKSLALLAQRSDRS